MHCNHNFRLNKHEKKSINLINKSDEVDEVNTSSQFFYVNHDSFKGKNFYINHHKFNWNSQ